MTEATRVASLNPNDAVQGGLLDDADVVIRDARFCLWDYNGKQPEGPALRVAFVDGEDKTHEQYYSAGKSDRYVPSDDGCKLLLTGTATGLNSGSNVVQFLTSLVNAGFPVAQLTDNISVLDGLKCHVNRVNQQARAGLAQTENPNGPRTILLVSKIHAMPGEKVKASGGKKGAGASAPPASGATAATTSSAPTGELADKAAGYVIEILAEAGGSIPRAKVSQLAFQKAQAAKDSDKSKITTLVFNEAFLRSREEFTFDGTTISMAA